MSRSRLQVGDVVRNEVRYGTLPDSTVRQCPGCYKFISATQSHCANCSTTFVPVSDSYVQVVGVHESATR